MIDWVEERKDLEINYRREFGNDIPELIGEFSDEQICDFLLECLRWKRTTGARPIEVHDLLDLQYQIKFPNSVGVPLMMIHMTEREWQQTIRECLKTGKPYELPADVQQLVEQGAVF